jgi:hypothetical protein
MPGRARHPVPASPPRGSRVVAACAVVLLVVQLLFAQLTLVLALLFVLTGRVSRWRLGWLAAPAAVGVGWALALGPGRATAGFAAGPAHVLDYLGRGRLAAGLSHPSGAFAGAGSWLPRQLPIALITGAAEAALIGSLGRLRIGAAAVPSSGPSAVSSAVSPPSAPPRRPGAIAAGRAALAGWLIRSGSVVTRDGCALGVAPGTGAVAELRWSEIAGGILVTGAEHQDVTVASLQVVHAALRRRKPLIVIDASADAAITRALTAACAATGTPLHRVGLDLAAVIGERSAALVRVGSAELAARACADITALAAGLRRIGVDGDGLVWVTDGERLPADAVAALIGDGRVGGLAVLIGTSSPAAAARLAGLAEARLILRVADPSLAAILAAPTSGQPVNGGPPVVAPGISAGLGGMTAGAEPASRPAVSASGLLSLGPGEFVLTVGEPVPRTITLGRLVPARLPRPAVGRERGWRRLRLDPA